MLVERTFDITKINAVVNHEAVYPWVHGDVEGPLDLSLLLSNTGNVALFGEHGGCIFCQHQLGLYEAHTQILPRGRGQWSVAAVRDALFWMFTHTDAVEIWTRCPKGNLGARALARAIGGHEEFVAKAGWRQDGKIIPAAIFTLKIQDWMRECEALPRIGKWFHARLDEEYALNNFHEPIHPEDDTHDRYVGAAVEMIRNGQPHKGAVFYNRWAGMAGYEPISIVRIDPVTVNIRDALLEVHGRNFFVASIRSATAH